MSFQFKCRKITYNGEDIDELVREYNSKALPSSILDKVKESLSQINDAFVVGDEVFVPVLPPFYKRYDDLIDPPKIDPPPAPKPVVKPEPVAPVPRSNRKDIRRKPVEPIIEAKPEPVEPEPVRTLPPSKADPKPTPPPKKQKIRRELTLEEKLERRPVLTEANLKYRAYDYTFSRPNETIEAVVRLYNDMNVSKPMIQKLCFVFSELNKESMPPKLGQTVRVPVLLPFCYRHENNHKIFTDE